MTNYGMLLCVLFAYGVTSRECPGSRFGTGCRLRCHCRDDASCNDISGDCPTKCEPGWSGPVCQRQNIAFVASVEVRKVNTTGSEVVDEDESTCITTRPNRTGWLKVDLGSTKLVYNMKLVAGNNTSILDWKIHVTDYNHDDLFWGQPCTVIKSRASSAEFHCDEPAYGQYVSIFSYNRPVNVCDFQVYGCPSYTYGKESCSGRCTCFNSSEVCHPVFGTCRLGCKPGVTGPRCDQACIMSYGSNCVHICGHCYDGESCDRVTGVCASGCAAGYTGTKCLTECLSGYYGNSCRPRCGKCKHEVVCHHVNGFCPTGCAAGWHGNTCKQNCRVGTYGDDCKFTCQNCHSSACDRVTGICEKGCIPGWEGVFCNQACLHGKYGIDCHKSCSNCRTEPCNKVTGSCHPDGCQPGFYGDTCIHECPATRYGPNCKYNCGECINDVSCNPRNGSCLGLCSTGWIGDDCSTKCTVGFYGIVCNSTCGVCKEREPCDHVTGQCANGCAEGFFGDYCTSTKGDTSEIVSNALMSTFVSAVGTIVALFLALLFVCIVIKWRQEKTFEEYDHRAKRKLLQNGHV